MWSCTITLDDAVWFCTLTFPLVLCPLLISCSWVLIFQVFFMVSCDLYRADNVGTMLLVSQTQHQIEVESEKTQATALQSLWAINPSWVTKSGVIFAEGAGAAAYVLLEDDTLIFLSYQRLTHQILWPCTTSTYLWSLSAGSVCKYLGMVGF